MNALLSVNPATGDEISRYPEMSPYELHAILTEADRAFADWREVPIARRAEPLRRAARVLRERVDELALLMTREMGKPLTQGRAEIEKCAWVCEFYAKHGAGFLAPENIDTGRHHSGVHFEPLGVVLAVMPWNFPFWQVFRFLAPGLLAGNAGVLKHASNVTGCALAIEQILHAAGFPPALFRTLRLSSGGVSALIAHPLIRAVTLTGSVPAGKAVAAAAGAKLKKSVLELGGSDPYLILDDADLDLAADLCAASRMINSGQSCIGAKRFLVTPRVREDFTRLFVEKMRGYAPGDPMDPATTLGPLARLDLREELDAQVQASLKAGARALLGAQPVEGPGAFYPPTVLVDVAPGMPAFDEEIFGPVAAVIAARDEAEAIRLANQSRFGLGAAVFTRDLARGREIAAKRLQAGACFVNEFVKSDPRLPFGGIGESGYGRELGSFGIREFVNIKTVCVA